jgi:type VI secretion system protein ImpG
MSQGLYDHYRDELLFIRKTAQQFRQRYPAAAARLQLEENRSPDPHVERLIEAFALLTARTQLKLNDEFPELTDALLHVLYPHFLSPIPSLAMMQFDLPADRGNENGVDIPAKSMLRTQRPGDPPCRFRTCYPLKLWPIEIAEARLHPPPFPGGLNAPNGAIACLRLRFKMLGDLTFNAVNLATLRIYLHGDSAITVPLYELLFNHVLGVAIRPIDVKTFSPVYLSARQTIAPVGFELDEGLLPYPQVSFPGYRLLSEFFAYPLKFLFADLLGWDQVKAFAKSRQVEFVLFLNRTLPRLEQKVDPTLFRLGCTPIINLFELSAIEPISLNLRRAEYRLEPDISSPDAYEIYSVDEVTGAYPDGTTMEYQPFYGYRHGGNRDNRSNFWYTTRKPALRPGDHGTDVFLHLVDLKLDVAKPPEGVIIIKVTCSNRDLPSRLSRQGEEIPFDTEFAAPGIRLRCLVSPTHVHRPPLRRGMHWRLISQLNLNHLSISDSTDGKAALQEILRLYDFTDLDADPQLSALARLCIEGIADLQSRRVARWSEGAFCRGIETTITFDEQNYVGTSMLLFSAVLERFLGLYVNMNSFSELVVKVRQREGELKRWPPRAGVQLLL